MGTLISHAADILVVKEESVILQESPDSIEGVAADTLQTSSQPDGSAKKIYLKFDASGLKSNVTKVEALAGFAMKVKYPRSAAVYLITGAGDSDWTAQTITWKNAPGNKVSTGNGLLPDCAVQLGTFPVLERGVSKTVELEWNSDSAKDALIEALNTGDRQATLVIVRPTTKACKFASLENMERGAHPFELTVMAK